MIELNARKRIRVEIGNRNDENMTDAGIIMYYYMKGTPKMQN